MGNDARRGGGDDTEGFVAAARRRAEKRADRSSRGLQPRRGRFDLKRATRELQSMIESRDWTGLEPVHFVALHAHLHRACYGVDADMTAARERLGCRSSAASMLAREFEGDAAEMLRYVKWVWRREIDTERWRRENNRQGGIMNWRDVYQKRSRLQHWRVDEMRRNYG